MRWCVSQRRAALPQGRREDSECTKGAFQIGTDSERPSEAGTSSLFFALKIHIKSDQIQYIQVKKESIKVLEEKNYVYFISGKRMHHKHKHSIKKIGRKKK